MLRRVKWCFLSVEIGPVVLYTSKGEGAESVPSQANVILANRKK